MDFRSSDVVFVDESKVRDYVMVATAISEDAIAAVSRALTSQLLPGQRRIHFSKESDARRRIVLTSMARLDVRAAVYIAPRTPGTDGRTRCLRALVGELVDGGVRRLFLERDESLMAFDRAVIAAELTGRRSGEGFAYLHVAPHERPGLWVSDAVAWSLVKGGDWSRRVADIVCGTPIRV